MLISLQELEFSLQMSDMSNAADALKGTSGQPEMSGEMPSLKNYLETYNRMSQLITAYKELLHRDAGQMKDAGKTMIAVEQNLLK